MDEVRAAGLEVLGVCFDGLEDNKAFAEKFDFPYPLLCDTDRTVGMAYHAARSADEGYARRISYLIDESGVIQRAYDKVDPQPQLGQILGDL